MNLLLDCSCVRHAGSAESFIFMPAFKLYSHKLLHTLLSCDGNSDSANLSTTIKKPAKASAGYA